MENPKPSPLTVRLDVPYNTTHSLEIHLGARRAFRTGFSFAFGAGLACLIHAAIAAMVIVPLALMSVAAFGLRLAGG